ncbi:hypothetical protein [Alkalicoccus daliensis]|uniref:Uncharacterized protein n=1 Tax=Alkalicoccus daliensis TaxID=745820 RepID=A0A1H0CW00_9BACI|nr:hypothetical protein [Alkalicoccus daliensis]SDN62025.1 hypothetical protein SAMN04488053_102250 [Alkalicoccus daliensis]
MINNKLTLFYAGITLLSFIFLFLGSFWLVLGIVLLGMGVEGFADSHIRTNSESRRKLEHEASAVTIKFVLTLIIIFVIIHFLYYPLSAEFLLLAILLFTYVASAASKLLMYRSGRNAGDHESHQRLK